MITPDLKEGELPNYSHGIAALLDIKNMLASLSPETIDAHTAKVKESFALTENERADREGYFKAISDTQAEKNALATTLAQHRETLEEIKAENKFNAATLAEIELARKNLATDKAAVENAKRALEATEAKLKDKQDALIAQAGSIDANMRNLEDAKKMHAQREAVIAQREASVREKQAEIEALLGRIK